MSSGSEYLNNRNNRYPQQFSSPSDSAASATPFRMQPMYNGAGAMGMEVMGAGDNNIVQQEVDEDVQICYDFTKNQCNRGDKCKYSHDIATIIKYNSREKGICFDFLRGQCSRGMLCKFSHDLSNIAHLYQQTNYGATGNNNSTSICYNFLKGGCRDGNTCRYSHDLRVVTAMARTQSTPVPSQYALHARTPAPVHNVGLNASDAALALLQLLQGNGQGLAQGQQSGVGNALSPRHAPSQSLDQLLAQQQLLDSGLGVQGLGVPSLPVQSQSSVDLQAKDYLNSPTDVISSVEGGNQTGMSDLENLVASLTALQSMQSQNVVSSPSNTAGEIEDLLAQIQALQMSSANSMQLDRTSSGFAHPNSGAMARGSRSLSMGAMYPPNSSAPNLDPAWRSIFKP
eukprot:TRINITY_DN5816_c0_g5_i1.p3 TRINITY_DN5816_c0_g5~~TRINITY_DN5816_c0_g5_i1.p3  ORF type:complete len:399 (-),score=67.38 TRINITY_DN5816_c0_g5_i1:3333-4529(-)